jgi:Flp pilus assembly protein TadG
VRPPGRRRDQRGSALVELTWLGLLLLIPLVYVVITIVTVQRSAFGATEAARAAGRAYVLAPDVGTAETRAYEAARIAMADQGVGLNPSDVLIVCHPSPQACLQPGSTVEVRLDLQVSLPLLPSLRGQSMASIAVESSHIEPYGVYREAAG